MEHLPKVSDEELSLHVDGFSQSFPVQNLLGENSSHTRLNAEISRRLRRKNKKGSACSLRNLLHESASSWLLVLSTLA